MRQQCLRDSSSYSTEEVANIAVVIPIGILIEGFYGDPTLRAPKGNS